MSFRFKGWEISTATLLLISDWESTVLVSDWESTVKKRPGNVTETDVIGISLRKNFFSVISLH